MKIALLVAVLHLCVSSRAGVVPAAASIGANRKAMKRQSNKATGAELVESSWNMEAGLVPFLWGSVDSDRRPIKSRSSRRSLGDGRRERRQTGAVGGGGSGSAERRSQRVTSAPLLQSLSLLDLPVFSRGDRPSSMDKTLGAIFSKVAFSAANASAPTSTGSVTLVASANKNDDQPTDKADDGTTLSETKASNIGLGASGSNSGSGNGNGNGNVNGNGASGVNAVGTTSTTVSTVTQTAASHPPSTSSPSSVRSNSKPVFEFDTRVFDFIPYDRTAAPSASDSMNRQYNPNVPGLRGPSRINTARHPANNQPFNSRPTIPPLVDLSAQSGIGRFSSGGRHQMTSTTVSSTTTTTTATSNVVTSSTTMANDSLEEDESLEETTASESLSSSSTTTSTTSTRSLTSSTVSTTNVNQGPTVAPGRGFPSSTSSRDGTSRVSSQESAAADSRDAAWSIQVYGTSSLFALLGIFALSNLLRLRTSTRRLLSTSHCLSIQLLVLFLAITRSIHLLYDAYNHRRLLPPALAFSIFNVAFPCLSSALAVLLLGIFKATKLQVSTLTHLLLADPIWPTNK